MSFAALDASVILPCELYARLRGGILFFFLMIRRPPRSTLDRSSAASDVYKRQDQVFELTQAHMLAVAHRTQAVGPGHEGRVGVIGLSLIHISEPTRPY